MAYPKEDIPSRVESSCVYPGRVRRIPLDQDSTGKPRYRALGYTVVRRPLVARDRIHDNEVNR